MALRDLATHAYIGVKDGSARAIVFDDPGYEKDTAKIVSDWIKMGRAVERLPVKEACERITAHGGEVAS
jgi:hypothetical protein